MALFQRMLKNSVPFLCALAILISLFPAVPVSAAEVTASGSIDGTDITWTIYDDGSMVFTGSDAIPDYTSSTSTPWYSYRSSITSVDFGDISSIGSNAFYCYSNLVDITFSDSLVSISSNAFRECDLLSYVELPDSLSSLGAYSFRQYSPSQALTLSYSGSNILSFASAVNTDKSVSILVGPDLIDIYRSTYPSISHVFAPLGSTWLSSVVPLSDYFTSSSVSGGVMSSEYSFSDCWTYSSSSSIYSSILPYNLVGNYGGAFSTLSASDQLFSFGDLANISSFSLSCSFTYTASGSASWSGARSLWVYFFDEDGNLLSSTRYGYSVITWPSGTNSYIVTTGAIEVPSDAVYWGCQLSLSGFSGLTVSDFDLTASLSLSSDPIVLPVEPTVSSSMSGSYEYCIGDTASPLSVTASVTDGGTLSYQWYSSSSNSTTSGSAISGATSSTYTPSTSSAGTKYYYCKVSNSLNGYSSVSYSSVAAVNVVAPAETPTFDVDLSSTYNYTTDDTASPLSVTASVTDGGTLSFQWYVNTVNSTSGGSAISGATSSSYTPSTDTIGTKYYYCRVTNTLGSLTSSVYSTVAAVVVAEPTYYLSGVYVFEEDLSNCPEFTLPYSGYFENLDLEFDSVWFDRRSLVFECSDYSLYAWTAQNGWASDAYKVIVFESEPELSATVYGDFCSAAYCVSDASGDVPYLTTITIDGVTYHFFDYLAFSEGYPSSPDVNVFVLDGSVVMNYGIITKIWSYTGSGDFYGLSLYEDGSDPFPSGNSIIAPGTTGADSDYSCYSVSLQTATIIVGDQTYTFTDFQLPDVTVTVTSTGLTLTDGVTTYTHTESVRFDGYMLSEDAESYLVVGDQLVFLASDLGPDSYTQQIYVKAFTPIIIAGQWECISLVMTGEYVDLSSWPDSLSSVSLTFLSNGSQFSGMSYKYDVSYGYCLFYDDFRAYSFDTLAAISEPGWVNRAAAQVYLPHDQTVDLDFYDWFIANFMRIGDDPVDPVYYTTVNIYDPIGGVLLFTETYHSVVAPVVSLNMLDNGCVLSYGSEKSTWDVGDSDFFGFNLAAGSNAVVYHPGLIYSLPGGAPDDITINLYVVEYVPGSADVATVFEGFASFLVTPLQAFFAIQFIPGISFGNICLIALLLGLLFWFLKISK